MIRSIRSHSRVFSSLLVVMTALFALSSVAFGSTCVKKDKGCLSTTVTAVYTGGPPIPFCIIGSPIVEVTSSATCKNGSSAGPVVLLRCGFLQQGFSYSGGGKTHVFTVYKGNWETILNGGCDYLLYDVQ